MEISGNLQEGYDKQYETENQEWREFAGKIKVDHILEVTNNAQFEKVLEYGAGEGSLLQHLNAQPHIKELYALEISDSGIEKIKQRELPKLKEVRKFDGYNTGYSDNEFDLVYCSHVIEHVEFPRLLLREIKRISKCQVFEVPLDYSRNVDNQMDHFLNYGHINIYTPSLFRFLLKSEGFAVNKSLVSCISTPVLKFLYFKTLNQKRTPLKVLKATILGSKLKLTKLLFGQKIAEEYYGSALTVMTSSKESLKIF